MCTKIFRATPSVAKAAIEPSGPLMLMWPMRDPVLPIRPCSIISFSCQSVPSKKTSAAPLQTLGERRIDRRRSREYRRTTCRVAVSMMLQAERVALRAAEVRPRRASSRHSAILPGDREGFDREAEIDARAFNSRRGRRAAVRSA